MQSVARISDLDYYTRAANDDCFNGGPRTRTKYTYDAAGNATSYGTSTLVYNNRGRVVSDTMGTVPNTFTYNPLGQLAEYYYYGAGNASSTTITMMYDEAGHLIGQYYPDGTVMREYVWMGDIPVAELINTQAGIVLYYVHSDQLNTPRKVTRPSDNALMWRWDPNPFGVGTANQNPAGMGTFYNDLRLPGQILESGTTFYSNGFRDYDPGTGRYLESDPIGLRGGINTYAFVGSNPISRRDPYGLKISINGSPSDYNTATAYLQRDPGMAQIIQDLNNSSTTYNIQYINDGNDAYDPTTNTIFWDPNSALRTTCGGTQTPALGLGHEMAHADASFWDQLIGWIPWPNYDNLEERRVITGPETNAAQTLGEAVRTNHGGIPYVVPSPTSR